LFVLLSLDISFMTWQVRHQGSPQSVGGLTLDDLVEELRDGRWGPTDEVIGPDEKSWTAIENHPRLSEYAAELEQPPRRHEEPTSLDMNALIDVCLVLLIFFILTTTYAAAVQKIVPMPGLKSADGKARVVGAEDIRKRMIRLHASRDQASGKIVLRLENQPIAVLSDDGETLDKDKLRELIKPFARGENAKSELLLDAHDVSWGMVIAIQDAAKAAGIRTVNYIRKK
jgi:biopolymer transport protein ExbD